MVNAPGACVSARLGSGYFGRMMSYYNGSYPLARPLFFYLSNKPSGEIKAFIDYVLSAEGQNLVEKVGYYPIK